LSLVDSFQHTHSCILLPCCDRVIFTVLPDVLWNTVKLLV